VDALQIRFLGVVLANYLGGLMAWASYL